MKRNGLWRASMIEVRGCCFHGETVKTVNNIVRFDPFKKSNADAHIFISHAHTDHLGGLGSKGRGYFTTGTMDILSLRGERGLRNFIPLKYGDRVKVGSLEVTVRNAGHMLGSAQYVIRGPESTIVYTGDINCRDMLTTNAAETMSCDILILETTYGSPYYVFPSLMETCTRIVDWTVEEILRKKLPVFKVYSSGKAQEVIKILNSFTNVPVVTHPTVTRVSEAYLKNGVELKYVDSTTDEGKELLRSRECAFITSVHGKKPDLENCSFAVATGWSVRFRINGVDAAFPLSSHADFTQLVDYVEDVKPKEVLTVHGFKENFARHLSKKLGVRARPLATVSQKPLRDFL
jgi:putative mRNA 3-end processing factor